MKKYLITVFILIMASCSLQTIPSAISKPARSDQPTTEILPPTPDFPSMSFLEKNNLYLQLLEQKQNAGVDTSKAEETYQNFLEDSLAGTSGKADQYLQEAILLLWH
jgi:hypothetical protein